MYLLLSQDLEISYRFTVYNYDAAGERNYKLTGSTVAVYQNGRQVNTPVFDKQTLYASALITINDLGYTKHYFEEGSRICSSIGSGGFKEMYYPIEDLYEETPSGSNGGVVIFSNTTAGLPWNAIQKNSQYSVEYAYRRNFNVEPYINRVGDLYDVVRHYESYNGDPEPVFYYHTDHLGSASYITDDRAKVVQQLAYMPYGEEWADIRDDNAYSGSAYKFNGKEKDDETGYNYYGARYYSDRLSIWLSVDPLADKYPSISPYAYCANNPVIFVDPDGKQFDEWDINSKGEVVNHIKTDKQDAFYMVDKNGNRTYTTDAEGNKHYNSISFEYGTITDSKKSGWFRSATSFAVNSESSGAELFKFFADNTKIEYGLINTQNDGSTVMTNHNETSVSASATAQKMNDKGQTVTSVVHNHPEPYSITPSGFGSKERSGDKFAASKYVPNAKRYVYQNGKLIAYDGKSVIGTTSWGLVFRPSTARKHPTYPVKQYPGVGLPPR